MVDVSQRDRMADEEAGGWDALVTALDRIPPAQTETPGAGPDDWSVKDVLFHLAAWADEAAGQLAAIRQGRYEARPFDTDARNVEYLRAGRQIGVGTARMRLERAHARLLAQWSAVRELSAPVVEWFGEDGAEHYAEHLSDIQRFADAVGSGDRPGAPDRRAALVAAEEEAWTEIRFVVEAIPDEAVERPGVTPAGWTVKDTMWHVAMWWQDFVDCVPRFSDPSFDPGDETVQEIDERNRTWFEESRDLPIHVVRERWTRAREDGLGAFRSIADPPRAAERWLEECGPIHYEKHLIDLRPWASAGPSGRMDAASN